MPGWNWAFIGSAVYHSILPALTIVVTSMAGWMLQMRNVMITTIGEDYVLAAQAKGLSSRRVIFTYAARNAILPNIAGFALAIGFVVAGALVMEIVFSYPGVGLTLYNAVTSDDYPLTQGIFLVISFAVLACMPDLRRGVCPRRSAHPHEGGLLMAVALPVGPVTACRCRARRMISSLPLKVKIGGGILGVFVLIAIIGPAIAPYDPSATTTQVVPMAPTLHHLLGTTQSGQDVLSQLLDGLRSTVVLGLLTGVIATVLAVSVGVTRRLPRRLRRRDPFAADQRVPRPAGAAAADRAARLPPGELRPAADGDRAQRARLAVGSPGDPRADAHAAQPRLRRGGAGER